MKRLALFPLLLVGALALSAETIDRVVATVNGRPILQSDVDDTIRYEAFVEGKSLSKITARDARAALDRLIDQELLRQQMGNMPIEISDSTLQDKVDEIRKQHAITREQWRQELSAYALDEPVFMARLAQQLRMMAFLERRLRPGVVIDRASVEKYYRDTLLPQLHKSGATQDPALSDVQGEIREILTQQNMDEMLTVWLRNLRQQSRVRLLQDTQLASTASTSSGK